MLTKMNSLKELLDYIDRFNGKLIHITIYRNCMSYYHHYIIIVKESECDNFRIVHYTKKSNIPDSVYGATAGIIVSTNHAHGVVELEIKEGLWIIDSPNYPHKPAEFDQAIARYTRRIGENAYCVCHNNCEHFATFVMTGLPSCEQIKLASIPKKAIADSIDVIVNNGKPNLAEAMSIGIISGATSTMLVNQPVESKSHVPLPSTQGRTNLELERTNQQYANIMENTSSAAPLSNDPKYQGSDIGNGQYNQVEMTYLINNLSEVTQLKASDEKNRNICNSAAKRSLLCLSNPLLAALKSFPSNVIKRMKAVAVEPLKKCANFFKNNALFGYVTCGASFATSSIFAIQRIRHLQKQLRTKYEISNSDFKREVIKTVTSVPASVSGSLVGTAIGQAVIPIPVVGAMIGGVIGNAVGKVAGSVVTGALFDYGKKILKLFRN